MTSMKRPGPPPLGGVGGRSKTCHLSDIFDKKLSLKRFFEKFCHLSLGLLSLIWLIWVLFRDTKIDSEHGNPIFFACGALREMLICLSIVYGVSQILSWLAVNPTVIIHEEQ